MSADDSNPQSQKQQGAFRIGNHEASFPADDFMLVRVNGSISVDDARAIALAERAIWENNDLLYLMVVVDATTSIESGTLSEVKTLYEGRPPHISVLVGANFALKTVGSVINRALRLFGRSSTLYFFNSVDDANVWIAEHRSTRTTRPRTSAQ